MHEKFERLEDFIKNPKKAFFTLSIPVAIGMFVQTLYNIVDTAFIGRLGSDAIAALTFTWPIFFIMIAITSGITSGMGSRISRYLGEKDIDSAKNTALHGVLLSIILGVLVFIVGEFTLAPILKSFGAEGNVLALGIDFMAIILFSFIFMFPAYVLSSVFSAEGETKLPMKIQIASLVINIILDPILIYTFKWGVKGAAIATLISIVFSFVLTLYLLQRKSVLKLEWRKFKYSKKIMKEIIFVGGPATLMMFTISIYIIFLNNLMNHFGTLHVAMFGIISRLESLTIIPIVAFSTSITTLVGMYHGAKRFELIKEMSRYGLKIITMFTISIALIIFILPEIFIKIFTNDSALIALSIPYLRIDVFTFPFMGITMMMARIMQGMGHGTPGLILQIIRALGIAIPVSYVSIYMLGFGYLSIAASMVIGGFIASLIGIIWLEIHLKNHHKEKQD